MCRTALHHLHPEVSQVKTAESLVKFSIVLIDKVDLHFDAKILQSPRCKYEPLVNSLNVN